MNRADTIEHNCLLGLGSNLGDRAVILANAVTRLDAIGRVAVIEVSPLIETEPVGGPLGQSLYLNGVVHVRTSRDPRELLAATSQIETELGRTRGVRWASRRIDIDILLYADLVLTSGTLTIPHPLLAVRRFVLEPASLLASDWHHPTLGKTLRELFAAMTQ